VDERIAYTHVTKASPVTITSTQRPKNTVQPSVGNVARALEESKVRCEVARVDGQLGRDWMHNPF